MKCYKFAILTACETYYMPNVFTTELEIARVWLVGSCPLNLSIRTLQLDLQSTVWTTFLNQYVGYVKLQLTIAKVFVLHAVLHWTLTGKTSKLSVKLTENWLKEKMMTIWKQLVLLFSMAVVYMQITHVQWCKKYSDTLLALVLQNHTM